MARFATHKRTAQGKARTIARRSQRSVKYAGAARITTAGQAR